MKPSSKPARQTSDKTSKPAQKTRTKYHPGLRRAAGLLYAHTAMTQKQIAEALEIPGTTLERWINGFELPPHRAGVQGVAPRDVLKELGERVKEQDVLLEDYRRRLIKMQRDPLATDELIADLRQQLALRIKDASVGEAASGLIYMLKIKEQELKVEALKKPDTVAETPAWFRDYVEKVAANPIVRPVPTDHDRGIIPDQTSEDGGDPDPTTSTEFGVTTSFIDEPLPPGTDEDDSYPDDDDDEDLVDDEGDEQDADDT